MSNSLAIATVTTVLAQIVRRAAQEAVAGADVVFGRPESNGNASASAKVQLYLYQVAPNLALSNADLPTRGADGKLVKRAQISLNLYYLLSFYGHETELEPQRLLGAVMRDLHAHPILSRQAINDVVAGNPFLAGSNLAEAVENIRFTPVSLNMEELSKLWSVFYQTPHALSVAYQGTVVIIESEETPPSVLPVLKRGADDSGVHTVTSPFPSIESIHVGIAGPTGRHLNLPSYPHAQLDMLLTISGSNLNGDAVTVCFSHPRLQTVQQIVVPPDERTDQEIRVMLPTDVEAQNNWAAGIYTVSVIIARSGSGRVMTTNTLALPLAPNIGQISPPNPIQRDPNGSVTLTITCRPPVLPEQQVLLLLGDRETAASVHPLLTDTLTFVVRDAPRLTDVCLYLRVDGVNSMPIILAGSPPVFAFDPAQKVTIP